jgi:hypothetical protein
MESPEQTGQVEETPRRQNELRANFWRMTFLFALGHGCATTPLVFASSSLYKKIAYIGNGTLYIAMMATALVFAVPMLNITGLKGGLILGFTLYGTYAGAFSFALTVDPEKQFCVFVIGSVCAGIAAGVIWTAQGGYMSRTASLVAAAENRSREMITAELAAQFAFYYLLFEEITKILFSFLLSTPLLASGAAFFYAVIAFGCAIAMSTLKDILPEEQEKASFLSTSTAAIRLWSDPRIWLLAPTNITFGMSAAFMNGFFNAHCTAATLGQPAIGLLTALTVLVSMSLSQCYRDLGQWYGKGLPLALGALSFGLIALLLIFQNCRSWNVWIVLFYALQGSGRAVYESTNKAVFSDTFKGAQTEGAFANCVLQMALSSAVYFFLSTSLKEHTLEMVILVAAMLTPVCYVAKENYERTSGETMPLVNEIKSA